MTYSRCRLLHEVVFILQLIKIYLIRLIRLWCLMLLQNTHQETAAELCTLSVRFAKLVVQFHDTFKSRESWSP